jgi:hypothetical protein
LATRGARAITTASGEITLYLHLAAAALFAKPDHTILSNTQTFFARHPLYNIRWNHDRAIIGMA